MSTSEAETSSVDYKAALSTQGRRAVIILADIDGNLLDYASPAGLVDQEFVAGILRDALRVARVLTTLNNHAIGNVVEADILGDKGALKVILDPPLVRIMAVES